MTPITDAQVINGLRHIFTTSKGSQVTQKVDWIKAGEEAPAGSFDVFANTELRAEEIQFTGFAKVYRFSVMVIAADAGDGNGNFVDEGDKLQMQAGTDDAENDETTTLRIHRIAPQPSRLLLRLDLGDEFEDGA